MREVSYSLHQGKKNFTDKQIDSNTAGPICRL